eukprot:CAMPEP_0113309038 /NCGR_PEP_ID=MMETSP0010_2-20120614/7246_1 /TAXON_ID=216773 ORGANISM="Corethron hystrix, Strain 308" /NCGR_SAMPLE_ID=MMETSP0010_2 /ASSEMBLY_ACC=CAM_ASM_000155 /LENGTH=532 /DNA_ID=CAMNT_0000164219 /DNA_START=289 /DNA_END=1884 /DNA_ORIENTATION=+ /assembly_acc=CAM_ASM_000155
MGSLDQPAETSLPPQIQVIKDRFDDDDTADGDSRTEKCFDFGESRSRFRVYCMNFCAPLTPQFDFSVPSVTATPASRPFELNYRQKVIEGRKRSLRFLTETHNNALAVRKTISKALKFGKRKRHVFPDPSGTDSTQTPNLVAASIRSLISELEFENFDETNEKQLRTGMNISNILVVTKEILKLFSDSVDRDHDRALTDLTSRLDELSSPDNENDARMTEVLSKLSRLVQESIVREKGDIGSTYITRDQVGANSLREAVVVVALWDGKAKIIRCAGSGAIIDAQRGLIITASHVVIDMEDKTRHGTPNRNFGEEYFGITRSKILIGILPSSNDPYVQAKFCYRATIIEKDVGNQDACVLRIVSKINVDLVEEAHGYVRRGNLKILNETPFNAGAAQLKSLCVSNHSQIEDRIRILGYNQAQIDNEESAIGLNRCMDVSEGKIVHQFKEPTFSEELKPKSQIFSKEVKPTSKFFGSAWKKKPSKLVAKAGITVECRNIVGQSGGPVVNDKGEVIGILSKGCAREGFVVPSKSW